MGDASERETRHWLLLLAATLGTGASGIPTYSIGLFASPLAAEFGWGRSRITFAITLTAAFTMLLTPFVGRLVDQYGPRRIALPAVCASALCLAMVGAVRSYPAYVVVWGLVGISGAFCSPVVWSVAVANGFSRNRGAALAISLSGIGLVGAIVPFAGAWLIGHLGWRLAYSGLAAYVLLVVVPVAFFHFGDRSSGRTARQRQSDRGHADKPGLTLREAVCVREFWVLAASFLLAASAVMSSVLHLVPILVDKGFSRFGAASALSILSSSAIAGRLAGGFLLDRLFAPRVGAAILLVSALAWATLAGGSTQDLSIYICSALIGLAVGAEFDIASFLTARYFGLRNYATIYGVLFTVFSIGITFGPLIFSTLYDRTGSYDVSLKLLAACFAGASLLLLLCRPYPELDASERG
ncbi:MFS transporter [Novosphingobium sp. PASSN1]|uniref:MFS transporter n=1 Tax=Novosphingobium sp. PASSN1 TaxID=2015561 RepID=UPI000BD36682|nr:MFS transporter [Novosphingobium sp. PASSN1]OYU34802.1 MAG: hypothetical protein CFE35_12995 [Novosphingobium sp. PASSN1]